MEPRARAAAEAHARRVADTLGALVGKGCAVAMFDTGSSLATALKESAVDVIALDPAQPWRAGTVPAVELAASGLPDWIGEIPHGAEILLLAELDPEGGSRAVRESGPIAAAGLAQALDANPTGVRSVQLVSRAARLPTAVVVLSPGSAAPESIGAEIRASVDAEVARLDEIERTLSPLLAARRQVSDAEERAMVAQAMRDRACARGWRRCVARIPSRAAATMRALRIAPRRPIALRRVPGQLARGLLRRKRKDRLAVGPELPEAVMRLRHQIPFDSSMLWRPRTGDIPGPPATEPPSIDVSVTIIGSDGDPMEAIRSADTDFVALCPSGVRVDPTCLSDLARCMAHTSSRVVAAPVGLIHLTELGIDLRRGESLQVGYFAPLTDGIVLMATADALALDPAGHDRFPIRAYDAARVSGVATFVSPDVLAARDLGEIDDDNRDAYFDAFGHLDEAVNEAPPQSTGERAYDGVVGPLVERRLRVRDQCDRLASGTDSELHELRAALGEDLVMSLAPDWVGEPDSGSCDPDQLRPPSGLEAFLAGVFRESPRLRDE